MKRLIALLLSAGICLGGASASRAVELQATGIWQLGWSWQDIDLQRHGNTSDTFQARTRIRPQFSFIASENLQGVLQLEVGRNIGTGNAGWGSEHGWAIGTDGTNVKTRFAYLDWVVPGAQTRLRMGLQFAEVPSFTFTTVMGVEMAGVSLTQPLTDWLGISAAWYRPYNDYSLPHDSIDAFLLSFPITADGITVTPWAMAASVGQSAFAGMDERLYERAKTGASSWGSEIAGMGSLLPANQISFFVPGTGGMPDKRYATSDRHPFGWWLGLGGEITLFDPFSFATDIVYGKFDAGSLAGVKIQREGWLAAVLASYKLDFMKPALLFWYASGDNASPWDGSERLPAVYADSRITRFGTNGGWYDGASLTRDLAGSWGMGLRLDGITFADQLSHNLRVTYYQGTNNVEMVRQGAVRSPLYPGHSTGYYLTTSDRAIECNFENFYNVYKNLTASLELGYIYLDLDKAVWASSAGKFKNHMYKAGVYLTYKY